MNMKIHQIKSIIIFILLYVMFGCEFSDEHLAKIRKDTNAETLVKELSKDSLFKSFEGFTITPRSWYDNIFIFFRNEDPKIFYWLTYSPKGVDYFKISKSELEQNRKIIMEYDSLNYLSLEREYLEKAYRLISVVKKLNIRVATGDSWHYGFSYNDSSHLIYVKEPLELDSMFYRLHKNINWIDNHFATYD